MAIQERIKKNYKSIKLPEIFEEQDRGFFKCCVPLLVLAGGSQTWENDVNSAWLKISDPSDPYEFILEKDGQPTTYTPTPNEFPNEPNAFYTTIRWADVLASDGLGCYQVRLSYEISGIPFNYVWATYNLLPFSIEAALGTARLRVKLNLQQHIEGINFTGANVEDCIRFDGIIRKDQPNTETENLIYSDGDTKPVRSELLRTYKLESDPYTDEILRKFEELYLLSANEMWISDYNSHNNSYRINDVYVNMRKEESPERDRPDEFSRKEIITCILEHRLKNQITNY